MTDPEIATVPMARYTARNQRMAADGVRPPALADTRTDKASNRIKPPIFRRFWSTGLLEQLDLQALQAQTWTRGIVEAKGRFDAGNSFCILASGLAVRYRTSRTGEKQSTALILPGDICDYSLITNTTSRAKPVALTRSSFLQLSLEQAIALSERFPNVLAAILAQLAVDQAVSEELLFLVARRTALERTAHMLCELEYRLRRMGLCNEGRFLLPMTQAEIGHHLGLTPVHVNRTMQELRRRLLIRTNGLGIELPDLPKLQRIAEFSPHYLTIATSGPDQHFDA